MNIEIKHYGRSRNSASTIIELKVETASATIVVDVTNTKGLVDVDLIQDLRNIADELEEQNNLVNAK